MRQIELDNGYMICVTCRGYIEANKAPICECLHSEEHFFKLDEAH